MLGIKAQGEEGNLCPFRLATMFKASGTLAGEAISSVLGAERTEEGVAISILGQIELRPALFPHCQSGEKKQAGQPQGSWGTPQAWQPGFLMGSTLNQSQGLTWTAVNTKGTGGESRRAP